MHPLNDMFRVGKFLETESKLMVAREGKEWTADTGLHFRVMKLL